ncbi:hypothetical protein PHYSODRAFT_372741, partial [Phytophthora sojae]
AATGDLATVKALLDGGDCVSVDMADTNGFTPLMIAAQAGHGSVMQVLFENGARAGETAADGNTALHLAARNGHLEACRILISEEADVNAVNEAGLDALMDAAQTGN